MKKSCKNCYYNNGEFYEGECEDCVRHPDCDLVDNWVLK